MLKIYGEKQLSKKFHSLSVIPNFVAITLRRKKLMISNNNNINVEQKAIQ